MKLRPLSLALGFTLVELMVVVAITGILLAVGVPQFQDFIARRAITANIATLSSSMRLARSEAIRRNREVTLCRSNNPLDVNPTCAGADGDWATGWIVFEVGQNRGQVNPGGTVLHVQGPLRSAGQVISSAANYTVTFRGIGMPVAGAATTFEFNPPSEPAGQSPMRMEMIVDFVGRTYINRPQS